MASCCKTKRFEKEKTSCWKDKDVFQDIVNKEVELVRNSIIKELKTKIFLMRYDLSYKTCSPIAMAINWRRVSRRTSPNPRKCYELYKNVILPTFLTRFKCREEASCDLARRLERCNVP